MRKGLLFVLCFLTFKSNAQIYYQDISPDVVLSTWTSHLLQIDSPATSTLSTAHATLTVWEEFNSETDLNVNLNCEVLMSGGYPAALNAGQAIGSTATWQAPNYALLYDGTNGNWQNKTDKYLGVRIKEGGSWLYGWVRMDVNNSGNTVTIKDYACNMSVGSSINAGQTTTTSVKALSATEKVSIVRTGNRIWFRDLPPGTEMTATIYDISGRVMQKEKLREDQLQLIDLPPGIYLLSLEIDGEKKTFKMVL